MRLRTIVGGGAVASVLLVGGCMAGASSATTTSPAGATATGAAPVTTAAPATTAPTSGPQAAFGNGQWAIGEEVVPGTYRSPGPIKSVMTLCMVSTESADGTPVDMQTSNDGPIRITVAPGQTVDATGCQGFTKVAG